MPKSGVPVKLVQLQFPPERWLIQKNQNYAVKVIFPRNCQLTYKRASNVIGGYQRFNREEKMVALQEHITQYSSRIAY